MANDSLAHHHLLLLPFAAGCSDVEDDVGTATVAFPSFWPPFPPLSPDDSDSDTLGFVTTPRRMDRSRDREAAAASAAFFGLGFRDVDDGDEWASPDGTGEVELPLCWDCLQLEDHDDHLQRWDDVGVLGDDVADGWEQVAARDQEEAAAARMSGLEWEVLLQATNGMGSLVVDDDDDDDLEGGIGTYFLDEDGALFEQIAAEAGHEPPGNKGGRPAAKAVVEGLPTVVVAEADGDALCAVCKDGVEAGDRARRRLPCAHLYHDGCILPWLAVRNTCPLCRHELPTEEDPEYER